MMERIVRGASLLMCFVVVGAVLGGCQRYAELPETVSVAKTRNLSGLQPLPRYKISVRTFVMDAAGKKNEVTAIRCQLRSNELSVSVVTPKRVSLPAFASGERFRNGGKPSPLRVTCSGNGMSGSSTIEAQHNFSPDSTTDVQYMTSPLDLGVSSSTPWVYDKVYVVIR